MKMNTVKLFFGVSLFLAFFGQNAIAQHQVSGILREADGKPLAFANVLLLNVKDSSLNKGIMTLEDGTYLLENVENGAFFVSFSMVGYKTLFSKTLILEGENSNLKLESMVLQENAALLGEVQIVAQKPFLEQRIDRTIINVSNSITNAGGNALQVLQRSPGVQVNALTKTISLMGKQGVVLMINGKISRLPSDAIVQMLEGMNANNIDRIELIHTPPANFEAEGNAGIINIVLKNTGDEGLNGGYSGKIGYGRAEKYGANVYFNFRKNKLNTFGSYDYNFNLNPQVFTNYRGVQQGNDFVETETYSNRPYTPTPTQSARLGLDYQVNKKTVIGILGTFFDSHWYMEAENDVKYSKNGIVQNHLLMPNSETNHNRSFSGNINLTHQFSETQTLNIDADMIHFDINNPSHYQIQNLDASDAKTPQYELQINKKTPINAFVTKADYTLNISKNTNLEFGGKVTFLKFDNDVRVDSISDQNVSVVLKDYTSKFGLNENVTGAYSSFSTKINKNTDLKLGLRYEYTNSNLGSEEQPNVVDRHYGSWFPSFFISHKIDENENINFSYSRRISRPQIRRLAPWLIFSDPTTLESGNIALQPSFTNALKLDYSIKTWHFGVSYSIENNPMRLVPKINARTNRQLNSFENLGEERVAAAYVSVPFHPAKWWEMQNSVFVNSTDIRLTLEGQAIKLLNVNYGFNMSNTLKLPNKITLEVSGNYNSPGYWGIAYWRANGSANAGIEKDFGRKWGKLRFNVSDIFLSSNWFGNTNQPNLNLMVRSSYQMAERTFMLTWKNTFGNAKLKSARNRQTASAEEMKRM